MTESLEELAAVAKPDTLLAWYRKLIANKFDGSRIRQRAGRPRMDEEAERLVVQMAKENPSWGYDRIVGALANLGYPLSDQTVGIRPLRCQRRSWPANSWQSRYAVSALRGASPSSRTR